MLECGETDVFGTRKTAWRAFMACCRWVRSVGVVVVVVAVAMVVCGGGGGV